MQFDVKAQETEKPFIWFICGGSVSCDFLLGYLARDQFLPQSKFIS